MLLTYFYPLAPSHLCHHLKTLTPQRSFPDDNDEMFHNEGVKRLYAFTCRAILSPEPTSRVTISEIDVSFHFDLSWQDLLALLSDIYINLQYAAVTAGHSLHDGQKWVDGILLRRGRDALLVLLLPLSPQFESLHIAFLEHNDRYKRMLLTLVHKSNLCPPDTAFGCLKYVRAPFVSLERLSRTLASHINRIENTLKPATRATLAHLRICQGLETSDLA